MTNTPVALVTHKEPGPAFGMLIYLSAAVLIGILSAVSPTYAVVLAGGIVGYVILRKRTSVHVTTLVYVLVLGLPLHALGMRILETRLRVGGSAALAVGVWKDVLLLVLFLVTLRAAGHLRSGRTSARLLDILILAYASVCLVYALVSPSKLHAFYGFRGNVEPFLFYYVFRYLPLPTWQVRRLTMWIIVLGALLAVLAVYQVYFWDFGTYRDLGFTLVTGQLPSTFTVVGAGWARPTATFSSPNTAGLFFALVGVVAAGRLQTEERRGSRILLLVLLGPIGVGLLYTMSRSGLVLAMLGLLPLVLLRTRLRGQPGLRLALPLLAAAVLALVVLSVRPGQYMAAMVNRLARTASGMDPSASGRLPDLLNAVETIRSSPFGVGLGMVGSRTGKFNDDYWMLYHTENYYLQIAMEIGILGGILLIAIYLCAGLTLWRHRSSHQSGGAAVNSWTALSCLGGTMAASMFIPQLNELVLAGYLWMFVGMALRVNAPGPSCGDAVWRNAFAVTDIAKLES